LCTVHYVDHCSNVGTFLFQYPDKDNPYGDTIIELQDLIDRHDVIVAFNAKFDLHWLRRYNIKFQHKEIRDIQYLYYILRAQTCKFPSLNEVLTWLGLPQKMDRVSEYWDMGYMTSEIPEDVLVEYGEEDARLTSQAYNMLWKKLNDLNDDALTNNYRVHMVDLLVLEEMEWNGDYYNLKSASKAAEVLTGYIAEIDNWFKALLPQVPDFNPGSNDQLSALLYGGKIYSKRKEHIGYFKSGKRVGEPKYKNVVDEIILPGWVTPNPKWATQKEGYYSVDQGILNNIRAKGMGKTIIDMSLRRSKYSKQLSTYCNSIFDLVQKFGWQVTDDQHAVLHGNLNQCAAITGRLASSNPNRQNIDGSLKFLFESRYAN
jgi:DNA polymerase I-like protein with 3'-5' exonuclease and polymerase domains